MYDYRLEYICLIEFLMAYDDTEEWNLILRECNLDFHESIKVLKIRLSKKEGDFYKDAYEVAKRIYK